LWRTKQPSSEVPFLTARYGSVVLLGRALLARERKAALLFLAGLLAGYAMLIRPLAIGLGIVLASCVALLAGAASRARRLGLIVALIAGNVTAVLPWEAWAYVKTHTIIPLSSGDVPTLSDGLTF